MRAVGVTVEVWSFTINGEGGWGGGLGVCVGGGGGSCPLDIPSHLGKLRKNDCFDKLILSDIIAIGVT